MKRERERKREKRGERVRERERGESVRKREMRRFQRTQRPAKKIRFEVEQTRFEFFVFRFERVSRNSGGGCFGGWFKKVLRWQTRIRSVIRFGEKFAHFGHFVTVWQTKIEDG